MYSTHALQDLWDIGYYIKWNIRNASAAEHIVNEIYKKIDSLKTFPERFPEIAIQGHIFRRANVKHYAVIYSVINEFKLISIERVLYSARDITTVQIG